MKLLNNLLGIKINWIEINDQSHGNYAQTNIILFACENQVDSLNKFSS